MWFLLLLFFLSPIVFVVTGYNINNAIYLLLLGCVTIYPLLSKGKHKISINFFYVLLALVAFVSFAVINGIFRGLQPAIIFKETLYYFKPVIFLFFGLFFLTEQSFNKLVLYGFFVVAVGSIVFFLNPDFYIIKAIEKTPDAEGFGHFYAIHQSVLRNSSLLLSPLETGYTLFFIASYFLIFYNGKRRVILILVSLSLLVSTFARSVVIGFIVTFLAYRFLVAKSVRKFYLLVSLAFLAVIIGTVYFHELRLIFVEDGSAIVHYSGLFEGLNLILQKPWGYGMGYSGFGSLQSTGERFISEGSFFTMIIEAGVWFVFFYVCLYYYLYQVSRKKFLPLYLGFLTASILIPIGFSTIFTALFFAYLGIIIKNDCPVT